MPELNVLYKSEAGWLYLRNSDRAAPILVREAPTYDMGRLPTVHSDGPVVIAAIYSHNPAGAGESFDLVRIQRTSGERLEVNNVVRHWHTAAGEFYTLRGEDDATAENLYLLPIGEEPAGMWLPDAWPPTQPPNPTGQLVDIGSRVVFASRRGVPPREDIFNVQYDGRGVVSLGLSARAVADWQVVGDAVWFCGRELGIYRVPLTGGTVEVLEGSSVGAHALQQHGDRVYFTTYGSLGSPTVLWSLNLDGADITRHVDDISQYSVFGDTIVYSTPGAGPTWYSQPLAASEATPLVSAGELCGGSDQAGAFLVGSDHRTLLVMGWDGTERRKVEFATSGCSVRGDAVFFVGSGGMSDEGAGVSNGMDYYTASLQTGEVRRLTNTGDVAPGVVTGDIVVYPRGVDDSGVASKGLFVTPLVGGASEPFIEERVSLVTAFWDHGYGARQAIRSPSDGGPTLPPRNLKRP